MFIDWVTVNKPVLDEAQRQHLFSLTISCEPLICNPSADLRIEHRRHSEPIFTQLESAEPQLLRERSVN